MTDLNDERIACYQELRDANRFRGAGRFIAEGWRVVERLLNSDLQIDSVLISERRQELFADRFADRAEVFVMPQKQAEQLVGYNFHAGVLACAVRPEFASLEQLRGPHGLIVCCPQIHGPDNLGSIIRLMRGFGADGLLLGTESADPYLRRVVRVSMGTIFGLPIGRSNSLPQDLLILKESGYRIIAAEESAHSQPLPLPQVMASFPRQVLILGNEAEGVAPELLELCDAIFHIPMQPGVDSLNVADAAAIFLYHFASVRRHQG